MYSGLLAADLRITIWVRNASNPVSDTASVGVVDCTEQQMLQPNK